MSSNKKPDNSIPSAGKLQHELKKKKPFESLAQEAWLNLVRTHSQLQIRGERMLAEFGLTGCQYNILRILRGEGHPLPILEVASRTISPVPGITGLIDRLEKAGWVCRERSTTDRRVIYVGITDPALELLSKIDQPLNDLHEEIMQPLSQGDRRELIRLLEQLRCHASEHPE
ncbi:MAG: transcriptional regulator, MarR family [Planctomycetaceae bacterium]|nr:transcriptional regulator, MarR family [Planctomycetaceae bacterium]